MGIESEEMNTNHQSLQLVITRNGSLSSKNKRGYCGYRHSYEDYLATRAKSMAYYDSPCYHGIVSGISLS